MNTRQTPDDVRGFGAHRSRVNPANAAEFDALLVQHGEAAPWHSFDPATECRQRIEGHAMRFIREFLRSLASIGPKRREVYFARVSGLTWEEIAGAVLGSPNKQAAQKEFADIIAQHPKLARAFPKPTQEET